jgi:hypothetical protein
VPALRGADDASRDRRRIVRAGVPSPARVVALPVVQTERDVRREARDAIVAVYADFADGYGRGGRGFASSACELSLNAVVAFPPLRRDPTKSVRSGRKRVQPGRLSGSYPRVGVRALRVPSSVSRPALLPCASSHYLSRVTRHPCAPMPGALLSVMLAVLQTLQPDTLLIAQNAATQTGSADATVASTFTERLEHSFAMLGEFVPALFGALVILFAGYLVAKLIEKGTQKLLRRVRFNQMLERGGVMQAVERSGSHLNPAKVIANVLFWFVMFAVLLVAANAIGLESLANVFSELVSYIPSVIAAIVIIILGIVLGGFVGGLIMASAGGLHGGPWLARTGRAGGIVLAVFMALQELGIATDIVTTAFAILFGAVALALALAFGLGNRELAAEVTREWYQRYRAERMAIDAEAAAEEAEELAEEASDDASDDTVEMPVPAAAQKGRSAPAPAETVRS